MGMEAKQKTGDDSHSDHIVMVQDGRRAGQQHHHALEVGGEGQAP